MSGTMMPAYGAPRFPVLPPSPPTDYVYVTSFKADLTKMGARFKQLRTAGEHDWTPHEVKDLKNAFRDLGKAMVNLQIPGGKIPTLKKEHKDHIERWAGPRRGTDPGRVVPLYGMFVLKALEPFRDAIHMTFADYTDKFKAVRKALTVTQRIDAKQALQGLRNMLIDLGATAAELPKMPR